MTKTLAHLADFTTFLKKEGYRTQIPLTHLKYYIAQKFGVSDYTQKSTIKALLEYGFIEDVGVGVFRVCDGWTPGKKLTKAEEKIIEQEADNLLKDVKHGTDKS